MVAQMVVRWVVCWADQKAESLVWKLAAMKADEKVELWVWKWAGQMVEQ